MVTSSFAPLESELDGSVFVKIRTAVNKLRPIIETGYENMLIVRFLYEKLKLNGTSRMFEVISNSLYANN